MQEGQITEISQLWRADQESLKAILVDCPNGTDYPAKDREGHTIYINSHFSTEEEAWKNLFENMEAGVRLAEGRVVDAKSSLAEARVRLTFEPGEPFSR